MGADKHYTYNRSWEQIEDMLERAERKQAMHLRQMNRKKITKSDRINHMRNYKALEGVIKSLRWVLGDVLIHSPLE